MTDNHTPRRTVRVDDELWGAFVLKHGQRTASARIRELMREDLGMQTAPSEGRGRSRNNRMTRSTHGEGTANGTV